MGQSNLKFIKPPEWIKTNSKNQVKATPKHPMANNLLLLSKNHLAKQKEEHLW